MEFVSLTDICGLYKFFYDLYFLSLGRIFFYCLFLWSVSCVNKVTNIELIIDYLLLFRQNTNFTIAFICKLKETTHAAREFPTKWTTMQWRVVREKDVLPVTCVPLARTMPCVVPVSTCRKDETSLRNIEIILLFKKSFNLIYFVKFCYVSKIYIQY